MTRRGVLAGMQYRTVAEDRILAMLRLGGWAYGEDSPAARSATTEALRSWRDTGLGVGEASDGTRRYDPVEVLNFFKTAGLAGRDPFWSRHWVRTGRRLVQDLPSAARFIIEFSRMFPSAAPRLRAPLPLPGAFLHELDVAGTIEGNGEVRVGRGRLEARVHPGVFGAVALHARASFTATHYRARHDAAPLSAQAEALYLRPREGWIVVTERVASLARRLAPQGTSPRAALAAFWRYLIDEFVSGAVHYDQVDVRAPGDWVLESGYFDCQLGSALLIALCRAIGLPARLVSGHVLYRLAPTNHYWAEVFLPDQGWTPFDLLSWDLSCGGRDDAWRSHFFGALDARMTTQILPTEFTGAIGVTMPAAWHILQSATPAGVAIELVDLSGRTVYRDLVSVTGADGAIRRDSPEPSRAETG